MEEKQMAQPQMDTADTLLAYSEWLDGEHLIKGDDEGDDRDHSTLVQDFIKYWCAGDEAPCTTRAPLADRAPDEDVYTIPVEDAIETLKQIAEQGATDPAVRVHAAVSILNYARTVGA